MKEKKKATNSKVGSLKEEGKTNNVYSKYFVIICAISIATILISNITSAKLFGIGKIVLPSSALVFPLSYIVGDVIAEVYGYKKAKFVILLGFLCNAIMVGFFAISIALPSASIWNHQTAYETVLSTTPRLFVASLSAFLVGSLSNAYVMAFIKKLTKGKLLWLRTIGSTIVGEFFDTLIFVFIGFLGTIGFSGILIMLVSQFIWKVGYEIMATPFTYYVINKFKKFENAV